MAKTVRQYFWLGVATLGFGIPAHAAEVRPLPQGKPEVREVRNANGGLSHCVADQVYANGMHLNLARNTSGQMNLGLVVPGAALRVGATYPLLLQTPATSPLDKDARASTATMLLIDFQADKKADADFLARVAQQQHLNVIGSVDTMAFALPYANEMLQQLEECAGQNTLSAPDRAVSAAALALPPPLLTLLKAAGIAHPEPLELPTTPGGSEAADYVWRYDTLTGGVRQRDVGADADLAGIVQAQLTALKQHCTGTWQQALSDIARYGQVAQQQRAVLACQHGVAGAAMGIVFHRAADGRVSVISHAGDLSEMEKIRSVTTQIATVLATGAAAHQ
jgi:hypothetical protein